LEDRVLFVDFEDQAVLAVVTGTSVHFGTGLDGVGIHLMRANVNSHEKELAGLEPCSLISRVSLLVGWGFVAFWKR
jgi:hypothetical protein